MDEGIPYLPIREYESECLQRVLEMEVNRDEGGTFEEDTHNMEQQRSNGWANGDSYSDDVDVILEGMGLGKYIDKFRENDIGLNILLQMTEKDLTVIGMTNPKDQACFLKNLIEFNGTPKVAPNDLYMIEEDLIMARNLCTHLEDINAQLNMIKHHLRKGDYEDYFITPKTSLLKVFDMVVKRAFGQTKRMSNTIFNGSLNEDNLIGGYLKADGLDLPAYLQAKLHNPNKKFECDDMKWKKWAVCTVKLAATFAISISASVYIYKTLIKK